MSTRLQRTSTDNLINGRRMDLIEPAYGWIINVK